MNTKLPMTFTVFPKDDCIAYSLSKRLAFHLSNETLHGNEQRFNCSYQAASADAIATNSPSSETTASNNPNASRSPALV
jgi:hypothetical protein